MTQDVQKRYITWFVFSLGKALSFRHDGPVAKEAPENHAGLNWKLNKRAMLLVDRIILRTVNVVVRIDQ